MSDDLGNTWMWERARNMIDQAERLQKQFAQRDSSAAGLRHKAAKVGRKRMLTGQQTWPPSGGMQEPSC